jgi:hypothetical protein
MSFDIVSLLLSLIVILVILVTSRLSLRILKAWTNYKKIKEIVHGKGGTAKKYNRIREVVLSDYDYK